MSNDAALPRSSDGWTLSALGVDNLRALRMDHPLAMRRLLLVVGRNGIGKSTLARVMPLLRQSAGTRTREPLLWWEQSQTDFGSFREAVRRGRDELSFTFRFMRGTEEFEVSTIIREGSEGSRVGTVSYTEGDSRLQLDIDDTGAIKLSIMNVRGKALRASDHGALPLMFVEPWRLFGIPRSPEDPVALLSHLEWLFHGNTLHDRRREVVLGIPWADPEAAKEHLSSQNLGRKYKGMVKNLLRDNGRFHQALRERFCWHAVQRLRLAEELVTDIALRSAYLGPFRAVPERTYRYQGVAVEQLDARGANLAMFLAALSEKEKENLNQFLRQMLNFEVRVDKDAGQYQLRIKLGSEFFNLLDVGFGYSQVLPVAVQLWAAGNVLSTSRTSKPVTVFVVEQPELHLHPHHQSLVARAFAASAAQNEGPIQIVETHSDHLVSEIGLLIAEGKLPPERVGVLCVEMHESGEGASVRTATYDANGVLKNWPAGFLSP